MAKDKDEATKADATSARSNATSGGERPKAADGPADAEKGAGTAVYPPPASDRSGERTANVAPSKQLPPDPPDGGGLDELARLRAENAALANVCRNLGGNPAEVARAATAGLVAEATPGEDTSKPRFRVTLPGVQPHEVHADDEQAAVRAAMARHGWFSSPTQPAVERVESPKAAERATHKGGHKAHKAESER